MENTEPNEIEISKRLQAIEDELKDFEMIIILPDSKKYSSALDYLKEEKVVLSEITSKLKPKENIHLYLPTI